MTLGRSLSQWYLILRIMKITIYFRTYTTVIVLWLERRVR